MSPLLARSRAAAAYGQAASTVPPARQIVLLFEGAIRRVKEAEAAIGERRIFDRFQAVQKATAIIDALQGCLDHDKGGAIAAGLERLYLYLGLRLQQINIHNDPAICTEVAARLAELRAAFAAIADGQGEAAPLPVPEPQTPRAYVTG